MRKTIMVAAAAAASLTVLGGVAVASIPGPDGVISGCRKNTTGDLRVVDSAASCPIGYTALNWNQTGPQGPAGVSGYERVENFFPLTPGFTYSAVWSTVQCPSGKQPLGGGGMAPEEPGGAGWAIERTRPVNGPPDGWEIQARRIVPGPTPEGTSPLRVYAICATVT
jgi:hypothetical protein